MREILDETFALLGKDIVLAHAKDLDHDGDAGHLACLQGSAAARAPSVRPVFPRDVPAGRPYPYMCLQNAINLGLRLVVAPEVEGSEGDELDPYERLLGDAMRGDALLFVRQDAVEAAWAIAEPILGDVTPVHEYQPSTWGPAEAERLAADVGGWHNPQAEP